MRDLSSALRITCGKVQLRLMQPRDAHALLRLASEDRVSHYLQWSPHQTVDDSLSFIRDTHELWERQQAFLPGIHDVDSGDLVGAIGLSHIDRVNRRAEVGTWIGLPYQGKHYNLPAKGALFAFAFRMLGMHRLELLVRTDNERSIAATRRLPGIIDEGTQHARIWRDEIPYDARMFAITATTFADSDYPEATIEGTLP